MTRTIRLEAVYPCAPALVWRALTDAARVAEWLMPAADFAPVVGQRFTLGGRPGSDEIVYCEVLAADEPRRLAYAWRASGLETRVTWTLEPVPQGTRVRLDHTGFSGLNGIAASVRAGSAWTERLDRALPRVLAAMRPSGGMVS